MKKGKRVLALIMCVIIMLSAIQLNYLVVSAKSYNSQTVSASEESAIQVNMIETLYNGAGGYVSCDFDCYSSIQGRHEGIDFINKNNGYFYSLTNGYIKKLVEVAIILLQYMIMKIIKQ